MFFLFIYINIFVIGKIRHIFALSLCILLKQVKFLNNEYKRGYPDLYKQVMLWSVSGF